MKCKFTKRTQVSHGHPELAFGDWMEIGYVLDHESAYKMVRAGIAIPEDDECRAACRWAGGQLMTDAEIDNAQVHAAAVIAGVLPEDLASFLAGEFTGFDGKGRKIPGPSASDEDREEYEEQIEDEQMEALDDE